MEELREEAEEKKIPLVNMLLESGAVPEEELYKAKAAAMGISFVSLSDELDPQLLKIIPEQMARQYNAVSFGREGNKLIGGDARSQ